MSVSRDFIDSCSPEAPARIEQDAVAPPLGGLTQASAQCGGTTLVFGFHATLRILRNALISLSKTCYRFLYLGKRHRPIGPPPRHPLPAPVAASPPSRPARPAADPAPVLNFVFTRVVNH